MELVSSLFFFFQAEDGIRDVAVTGVQTCALPIFYAGTKGDAVYKSYDGGQRWVSQRTGLDDVTVTSVVNQIVFDPGDRKSTRLNSSHGYISYAVFCLKKKKKNYMRTADDLVV